MTLKENYAAMEARQYCCIMHSGYSHHCNLSLPTHQHWQLNNSLSVLQARASSRSTSRLTALQAPHRKMQPKFSVVFR